MSYLIFPEDLSSEWGSKKRLRWETTVKKSASGLRKSMTNWSYPEIEIEATFVGLTDEQAVQAQGFICSLYGRLSPFLWRDFEDYKVMDAAIAASDGTTTNYQLVRLLGAFKMPVRDIKANTLTVKVAGEVVAVTLLDDGIIRFASAPANGSVITASFEYYWRVAFSDDETDFEAQFIDTNKMGSIKMVTVR